ncbi:PREDICTED: iron-responsive element-binding protein 2 isoform X2 [Pseudopodoces humilis]|uniref:iron-responsive element-binding protein 2 isoform X2 n=1 Tax=Pseudopodoces humilis TaxID=181119 RepID=UPI0003959F13|nr:PREDICTED: iron-responsive element-binding protein 2 isoform X2 [Pseudopodoces humilis]
MDPPRTGSPYQPAIEALEGHPEKKFYNVSKLGGAKYDTLPYSIRVLFESSVRNCDGFLVKETDAMNILDWKTKQNYVEVPFCPARVVLQDFTGIPAMVDFAAMREAVRNAGGDPVKVNPACPTDLTVDHSLQIDFSKWPETVLKNQEMEFGRNRERLQFFKWSSKVFENVSIIPPETGMAHQVNLEYLSRVVFDDVKDFLHPDSVVGTDSHTTMVNGLGILGWGVGGIETEAVMLGMPLTLTLPEVVGCELTGTVSPFATSIDIVLSITKHLRQADVAGKFVEFFGSGVSQLSIADRTTIANMCPEYGAILSFFPVDNVTLKHLKHAGFDKAKLEVTEAYLKAVKLFRDYESSSREPEYSQVVQVSLSSIIPYVSGPKRSQDRVAVNNMKSDFQACLNEKSGVKGFQIAAEKQNDVVPVQYEGNEYKLSHGCVVIAAVISCTNNCNPSVMLAAGLLAKKAVEAGLVVKPYIRTSLSPGSGMVTHYLSSSGVLPYLSKLGFEVVGYGCSTCVGNMAPLPEAIRNAIKQGDIIACGVLSGTKNFEGRLCDCVRANYLASPPLVVAYAIAGTVRIDFDMEPLGTGFNGKSIYLRDIWPTRQELHTVEEECVISSMFKELKEKMEKGNKRWNLLEAPESTLFPWDLKSTYIRCPSFFDKLAKEAVPPQAVENAHVLLFLGDSVTTDHISPAGSIARSSAAAKYLTSKGLTPREFNSYGARRGNDAVMTRGTFANIKLLNKFIGKPAPKTVHFPSGQTLDVFEAAELYQKEGIPVIILAGKKYGLGSSRDWAAKGPFLLGVKAVLAESYEKVHRSQLIGIGIAPLQFRPGENPSTLGLTGREQFSILFPPDLSPRMTLDIKTSTGKVFSVIALFENNMEITLYKNGGSLNFVARRFL